MFKSHDSGRKPWLSTLFRFAVGMSVVFASHHVFLAFTRSRSGSAVSCPQPTKIHDPMMPCSTITITEKVPVRTATRTAIRVATVTKTLTQIAATPPVTPDLVDKNLYNKLVVPLSLKNKTLSTQFIIETLIPWDLNKDGKTTLGEVLATYKRCTTPVDFNKKMVHITRTVIEVLSKKRDPPCEFISAFGTAIGLHRGRLIPWELDADFWISEETEQACLDALHEAVDQSPKGTAYELMFEDRKRKDAAYYRLKMPRLPPLLQQNWPFDHSDFYVFRRLRDMDTGETYLKIRCPEHERADSSCRVVLPESVVFPAVQKPIMEGFEAPMPRDMEKYIYAFYPPRSVKEQRSRAGGDFCFLHNTAIPWIQDYLLDGYWRYIRQPYNFSLTHMPDWRESYPTLNVY